MNVTTRLQELEQVIERGLETFVEVGNALREIRDAKLYKNTYSSFEEYCRVRWDMSRPTAYEYMQAAAYVEENVCEDRQNITKTQALTASRDKNEVHFSSDSSEWYTPPEIVERAQAVLGDIDLDPCCNPGTPTIPAKEVFREEDNGLAQLWHGKVYMNPPYGREIGDWVKKLCTDYAMGITKEAIALIPARVDTDWFKYFRDFPICFISHRLKFSDSENSAPFPSAVVYLGSDYAKFHQAFASIGDIWVRFRGEA